MLDAVLAVFVATWTEVSPKLATLLGLILLDVIMGVARAIRQGAFDWRMVGMFYKTMVLPYLMGWFAIAFTMQFISTEMLPKELSAWLNPAVINLSWLVIAGTIGVSIKDHVVALYQKQLEPRGAAVERG